MLINASLQRSEFFLDTVRGLCPNTTYEFAAWIMNVIKPSACGGNTIKPNLTFNIEKTDGTIVQSYSTGDIAPLNGTVWQQSGFFFTTPVGISTVVLRMVNNSTGGCGNDIAIDDITFRACGPTLKSYFVGEPSGNLKQWCEGEDEEVTLQCDISTGYNNPYLQWQQSVNGGISWQDIAAANTKVLYRRFPASSPAQNYLYRMTVTEQGNIGITTCRVASGVLTVRINGKPVTNLSSNSPVCEGGTVTLSAQGGTVYRWSGVHNFSASGKIATFGNARLSHSGEYIVVVTDSVGCVSNDTTTITVLPVPVAAGDFSSRTICQGQRVLLSSSGGTSYEWQPSIALSSPVVANPVANPSDTIEYQVIVGNGSTCYDTAVVTINVIAKPEANAGPDQVIVEGQSVQLHGSITGNNTSFTWFPNQNISNFNTLKPTVSPINDIRYILHVTSNDGCGFSADTTFIRVYKNVIIPSAFSPNGDGINDVWNITALHTYNNFDFSVFNRYGQIVYQAKNYNKAWDGTFNGKPLPVGTYYYVINLKVDLPILKGYVVILR